MKIKHLVNLLLGAVILSLMAAIHCWAQQVTQLIASDSLAGDFAGNSVSLSSDGSTALVGVPGKTVGMNQSQGLVRVYVRTGGGWLQQTELTAPDGAAYDWFGYSVSLSGDGDTALVGASKTLAYVFTRSDGMWSQQAELIASDVGTDDTGFGRSVSLSSDGDTALVGAWNKTVGSNQSQGAAYLFKRSNEVWSQQAELTASDGAAQDFFGGAVSLSGDGKTALIGAYNKNRYAGAAYVFILSSGVWSQWTELTTSDSQPTDFFGFSVSLSGDGRTALVGAPFDLIAHTRPGVLEYLSQGAAYVFRFAAGAWSQQGELTASDGAEDDLFGYSVSLSSDGYSAFVGAPNKAVGSNVNQGAAYAFSAGNTWGAQEEEPVASDDAAGENFGFSVSLSSDGKTALAGAPFKNSNTGVAYGIAHLRSYLIVTTPPSTTAGAPLNFTVTALDYNNLLTNYSGLVHFTSSDPAAILPPDTFLTNGTATLAAFLNTEGAQTITATDAYSPSTSGTSTVMVGPGAGALLNGGNTFNGDQTVHGVLMATSFAGDGSGLTGVVLTTGAYFDPSWLRSLSGNKIAGEVAAAQTAEAALGFQFPPAQCATNMFSTGIGSTGNANCVQPAVSNLSDNSSLVLKNQANTFAGGKQTLPASATGYASLNFPSTGSTSGTPAIGDLWLTAADRHIVFRDNTNTTQRLAFLADVTSLGDLLGANNTFTGGNTFNQAITGSISGNAGTVTNGVYTTGSYSDPNWITSVSGRKITGTVAMAASATTPGTATSAADAANLGGVPASNYARLNAENTFMGNQNVTGNVGANGLTTGTVTIGSAGTPIKEHLSVQVNANFPALAPNTCASSNFTLSGAADGDTIALGIPSTLMSLGGTPIYMAWVSAADTVTVQVCNVHLVNAQVKAGSGSIRIDLWKH